MSIISRLSVILGLDSAQFNAGLGQAEGSLNKFSSSAKTMGVGAATALAAALSFSAKQALEFANDMTELAKANDMAVSSVLEISSALSTSGGKIDNTSKILSSFTNKVDEAAQGSQKTRDKFKELGVSLDDIGKLSEQDLLRKTIEGLSKIEDPIRRNALAFDLLGKGIKGVDLKDFNKDLDEVKGSYDKSEESFRKIEEWGNKIAKSWFDAKVAMADFIVGLATSSEKNKEFLSTRNDYARAMYGLPKQNTSVFSPIDTTGHPNFAAVKPSPARETKVSDEQQKVLDKQKSIREAMVQQSMEYERQLKFLGETQTNLSKLMIEFEKGGKYAGQQNTEVGKQLITNAKNLDLAIQKREATKAAYDLDVAHTKYMQEQEEKRFKFQQGVDDVKIASERMEYEKQLGNLSDTQTQKALQFFDLRQKIMRMSEDTRNMTADETKEYEKQLEVLTEAEQMKINAAESLQRYQNTFGYGWDKAFANFKERATDSFSMGQNAFNSMTSSMESALDRFVETGKVSFGDLTKSILADLIKIQLKAQATGLFSSLFGNLGGLFGGNGGVGPDVSFDTYYNMSSMAGFADGGSPSVGVPSIVGERGPELFVPKTSGTIIPNNQLSSALGGGQQVIYNGPYIANLDAIDTQSAIQFLAKNKQAVWAANQSAQRGIPTSR